MTPQVAFHTLGCKVNQYDTQAVAALFREAGYEVVDFAAPADVYVVNTCTVTSLGDKKSRQALRRAHRRNPGAVVVAMGCYAQTAPGEVAGIPGVDLVVGTAGRRELVAQVEAARRRKRAEGAFSDVFPGAPAVAVADLGREGGFEELGAGAVAERTRAAVKVQEGCRQFCSYCKVPYARGPERSRPPAAVRAEVERLVAKGFREVVLTGIHLGSYGRDLTPAGAAGAAGGRWDLARLAREVAEVPGLKRLRLSSLEPTDVTDDLLALVVENRVLCRHFHLPLQGGEDTVLRRMNRHYATADYARVVERVRAAVPGAGLTTDLIAGFPGETEEMFGRTLAFVREMAFSRLHVFPYSRRRGTPAAAFPGQVPAVVKRERVRRLIALGRDLSLAFHERLVGETVEALFEEEGPAPGGTAEPWWSGLTDTYVRVLAPSFMPLAGEFREVQVERATPEEVFGRLRSIAPVS